MKIIDFDLRFDADKLLVLLVTTDLLFLLFHVFHVYHLSLGLFYDANFSLQQEQGFAEVFQYLKEYWCALLLGILALRTKNLLYLSWALLFGYFLIDDSFGVHEILGRNLGNALGDLQMAGLSASDLGELFISAFFGGLLFLAIGVTYRLNDDESRQFSRHLFILFLILMVFGVFTSFIKRLSVGPTWSFLLGTLEESGEMIVMSVIAWFIIGFDSEELN